MRETDRIMAQLKRELPLTLTRSLTVVPIHDPRQTHAVFGVSNTPENIARVKEALRVIGANKFRMSKANSKHLIIICFNKHNIDTDNEDKRKSSKE